MKTDEFLTYLRNKRKYSALTVSSYQIDLTQFEEFLTRGIVKDSNQKENSGDTSSDGDITDKTIRAWLIELRENNISARSINRKLSALRAYFKWKETNDSDFKNPLIKIRPLKTSKRKISALSVEDMQDLLKNYPQTEDFVTFRDYLIVEILYSTGMRRSELLNLKNGDISFSSRYIRVLGKGSKERIIPIGEKLIDDLIKYFEIKKRLNISNPSVIAEENGTDMSNYRFYSIVHKLLENYNVSERSPHVFRHTCATHLVSNGADIVNVKNLLGHSSLKATEVYTHTTVEELKKEYKRSFERKFNK